MGSTATIATILPANVQAHVPAELSTLSTAAISTSTTHHHDSQECTGIVQIVRHGCGPVWFH